MPPATPINVGVIGLGFMGSTHIQAYAAAARAGCACRLVAVADPHAERLAGLPTRGNLRGAVEVAGAEEALLFDPAAVKTYAHAADLIADDDVQLVSICTPTQTHVDLAIAALEAGRHVLLEKPVAVSSRQVQRLADFARDAKQRCVPAMCIRFWPAWRWLKQRIDDGALGAVRTATFHRLGSMPAWADFYADHARSGGALFDLHIHDADFIYHCFGPPDSVSSVGTINHVQTQYRYAGAHASGDRAPPALVSAEGGWGHDTGFGFKMRYLVNFENGTADFDIGRTPQLLLHAGGESREVDLGLEKGLTGYDMQVRHILDLITGREKTPLATLDDAAAVARLLEAERTSIETGRPVELA
jgi:predicted dehydrogenase